MATDWLRYANQGATRNQPLDPRLISALGFLPNLGVQAEVFSGGQDAEGPNRTGSHRHDHGGAGDMRFYKDGRMLDWANPADRPVFEDIVRDGKAAGLTGFGAGPGYMSEGSMHVGFGSPAVWGAGGKSENAPDWLKAAYNGSPAAAPGSVAALTSDPVMEVVNAAGPSPAAPTPAPAGAPRAAAPTLFGSLFGGGQPQAQSQPVAAGPSPAPAGDLPPQGAQNIASGIKTPASNLFGALALMGQQQGPQFSPVQIQGPSAEQSQGLSQLVQALRQRLVG